MQAAYRFLSNDDVEFETLLQPHCAATEERISWCERKTLRLSEGVDENNISRYALA